MQREITQPVELCRGGRLNPEAVGWSRRPLHHCNVRGWRAKRWNYWCATDRQLFVALLVADLGYAGFSGVTALDVATGARLDRYSLRRPRMGDRVDEPVDFAARGLALSLADRLIARTRELSVELAPASSGDTLNVVVPWDGRRFQFTSKQIGLPVSGRVVWNGRVHELANGFAALDFGRGVWPARTGWGWAAAAGGGMAFNFGTRWTDGTGATENALFVGGKMVKLDARVELGRDFGLYGDGVELRFTEVARRKLPLLDWRLGRFDGRILDHRVEGLFGWSESFDVIW